MTTKYQYSKNTEHSQYITKIFTVLTSTMLLLLATFAMPSQAETFSKNTSTEKKHYSITPFVFHANNPQCESTKEAQPEIQKSDDGNVQDDTESLATTDDIDWRKNNVLVFFERDDTGIKNIKVLKSNSEEYSKNAVACLTSGKLASLNTNHKGRQKVLISFSSTYLKGKEIEFNIKTSNKRLEYISEVIPQYPKREINRGGRYGLVTLQFVINKNGKASKITTIYATSRAFERSSVKAIKMSLFDVPEVKIRCEAHRKRVRNITVIANMSITDCTSFKLTHKFIFKM